MGFLAIKIMSIITTCDSVSGTLMLIWEDMEYLSVC